MNYFTFLLLLMLLKPISKDHPLKEYQWKNRIIIVSSTGDNETANSQLESLYPLKAELEERDLIIVYLEKSEGSISQLKSLNAEQTRAIRKDFKLPENEFSLTLIGKDGTVKRRTRGFTEPQSIFDLIDSMPMRKAEINRKN